MIRVLIVEDDFRVAELHARQVAGIGDFEVLGTCRSLAEARQHLQSGLVDLLLLDSFLPDGSGIDLLVTGVAARAGCDVMMVTADNSAGSVTRALQLGAVNYLIKPFGYEDLVGRLEAYARFRRLLNRDELTQNGIDAAMAACREGDRRGTTVTPTGSKVEEALAASPSPLSAAEMAGRVGIARATAQRYLTRLVEERKAVVEPRYGTTGRPELLYRKLGGGRDTDTS